ncbi:MAG: HAD-IA family hydrolase [Pseudomonadota bacterium]
MTHNQQKKYDLVIFDWDGTLANSIGHLLVLIRRSIESVGLEAVEDKHLYGIFGLSFDQAIRSLYPDVTQKQLDGMTEFFTEGFKSAEYVASLSLFPGVVDILNHLKQSGYLLAVATGKRRIGLDKDFAALNMGALFDTTRCGDETFSKPHPQMVEEILTELVVEPSRALMVGDSIHDMQMGLNAGTDVLAVSYGVCDESVLKAHGAIVCIDDIKDLTNHV